jgi:hypothetical protein
MVLQCLVTTHPQNRMMSELLIESAMQQASLLLGHENAGLRNAGLKNAGLKNEGLWSAHWNPQLLVSASRRDATLGTCTDAETSDNAGEGAHSAEIKAQHCPTCPSAAPKHAASAMQM